MQGMAKNQLHKAVADGIKVYCNYDEIVSVTDLKPNPENPNRHPAEQINKYSYVCKHGTNVGGWGSKRSKEREIEDCKAIMKKWGSKIIKYEIPPRCKNDLLNGRFRVPIKGV